MEIVKATTGMIDDIARIGFSSWNSAYKGIIPDDFLAGYSAEKRANALRKIFLTRPEEYYLFKSDGVSIGFAIIGPPQDQALPADTGEIHALYFVPDSWGRGYAKQAMSFCLSRFEELGYRQIILWVLEENRRARRFYEKHGFSFTGREKEIMIGKPLNEICYSLELSSNS